MSGPKVTGYFSTLTSLFAVLCALVILLAMPLTAKAVSVTRAELKGSELRVEGEDAAAGARVTVTSAESTASTTADGGGEFRIRVSGFQSSTCQVVVSDGVSSAQVNLSGCTPSAPTATATTQPPATDTPQPTATATEPPPDTNTPQPTATPTTQPEATATPVATATPQAEEPRIESLTFDPNPVPGGEPATGIIVFTMPLPDDTLVHLQSNRDDLASIPPQLTAPAGATVVTFPVTTTAPAADTSFTMFATAFAVTKATTFTVLSPPPPPDADTVRITRAEYKDAILRVEATSTSSNATLTVYLTSSGSRLFTLTHQGGGKYEGEQPRLFAPSNITVKSSLGGSDSADVEVDD